MLAVLVCLSGLVASAAGAGPKFELRDGDRVVLIGDALIERDQEYGYLETLLTLQNPDKAITFRNLGWSGDTVFGDARAGFGTQADGFNHLKEHILALKPTVVIVGYGMTDSFAGEAGLPRFVSGLNTLLDVIAETKARVVLLSPIAHQDLGRPLPDPAGHNRLLKMYRDAIEKVAGERGYLFVDLFGWLAQNDAGARDETSRSLSGFQHLTDDGIHPTQYGYRYFAKVLLAQAGGSPPRGCWAVIDHDGKVVGVGGTKVTRVESSPQGLKFEMASAVLPLPLPPSPSKAAFIRSLTLKNLPPGRYHLKIDGRDIAHAGAEEWDQGRVLDQGPEYDQVDRLRQAINEKNRLYFYRWRPQNETYLFGFRKHEQGKNAREIPLFDPLVDAKEAEIATLKKPVSHLYELIREGEAGQ
jgi:hypothetical protein